MRAHTVKVYFVCLWVGNVVTKSVISSFSSQVKWKCEPWIKETKSWVTVRQNASGCSNYLKTLRQHSLLAPPIQFFTRGSPFIAVVGGRIKIPLSHKLSFMIPSTETWALKTHKGSKFPLRTNMRMEEQSTQSQKLRRAFQKVSLNSQVSQGKKKKVKLPVSSELWGILEVSASKIWLAGDNLPFSHWYQRTVICMRHYSAAMG